MAAIGSALPSVREEEDSLARRIRSCGSSRDLAAGKRTHNLILGSSHSHSRYLGNLLVEMYGKCRSLEDAQETFGKICDPNVFSWNLMINVCIENGSILEAQNLFEKMPERDAVSWTTLITAYAQSGDVVAARSLFDQSPCSNVVMWTAMIAAYSQSGKLKECEELFKKMAQRDTVSWNSMIQAYAQKGFLKEALELFEAMPEHSIVSSNTLIAALGKSHQVEKARKIFDQMLRRDLCTWVAIIEAYASVNLDQCEILFNEMPEHSQEICDFLVFVYASKAHTQKAIDFLTILDQSCKENSPWYILIRELSKSGKLLEARKIFISFSYPSLRTWTSIITAYAQHGHLEECWNLFFNKLPEWDSLVCTIVLQTLSNAQLAKAKALFDMIPEPDLIAYTAMLTSYAQNNQLHEARALFDKMPEHNSVSWNIIMRAYAQNRNLHEAKEMFDKMPYRTIVSWNTMLTAYAQSGKYINAEALFDKIPEPDLVSFTTMIEAYTSTNELERACFLFDRLVEHDLVCSTAMIRAFSLHGHIDYAVEIYHQIPSNQDTVSNTAMLLAYAENGHIHEARRILNSMAEKNLVVWNAMLAAYSQTGDLHNVTTLFKTMPSYDTISWNTIITTNAQTGNSILTLELVALLAINGLYCDAQTFSSVFHACSHAGKASIGRQNFILLQDSWNLTPTVEHYSYMIAILCKSGQLQDAEDLLLTMPYTPNDVAWTTLLAASRMASGIRKAECAAAYSVVLEPRRSASYVLLSNVYGGQTV